MALVIIDAEKFKAEIFDYTTQTEFTHTKTKPVILNFFATWCGPCHAFAPALEALAEKHESQIDVYKIDIDQHPEIPRLFGVMSVPTTVFFIPNEEPALVTGNIGDEGLQRAVQDLFGIS
jgi:thioredoxin 1